MIFALRRTFLLEARKVLMRKIIKRRKKAQRKITLHSLCQSNDTVSSIYPDDAPDTKFKFLKIIKRFLW